MPDQPQEPALSLPKGALGPLPTAPVPSKYPAPVPSIGPISSSAMPPAAAPPKPPAVPSVPTSAARPTTQSGPTPKPALRPSVDPVPNSAEGLGTGSAIRPPLRSAAGKTERPPVKIPSSPSARRFAVNPLLLVVCLLALFSILSFVAVYLRVDGVQTRIAKQDEKLTQDLGDVISKLNLLLDADKKRDDTVAALKKKTVEAGELMIAKGQLLMDRGEVMKRTGELIKASETARSEKGLMDKADTVLTDGANMVQDGDAMKQTGAALKAESLK